MKITNFCNLVEKNGYNFAEVTVTTGILWWKKEQVRVVYRQQTYISWKWLHNSEYTDDDIVENLECTYLANLAYK